MILKTILILLVTVWLDKLKIKKKHLITFNHDEHIVVEAKPGVGKTHTLIHRAGYLAGDYNCDCISVDKEREVFGKYEDYQILVLSFSQTAVRELKKRMKRCKIKNIEISTFDSFVGRIFYALDIVSKGSYDDNISYFVELLGEENDRLMELLDDYRYLVVDEAQDLNGFRIDMILKLREEMEGSMIFCDPNQAIFDFMNNNHGGNYQNLMLSSKKSYVIDDINHRFNTDLLKIEENISKYCNNILGYKNIINYFKDNKLIENDILHSNYPLTILVKNKNLMFEIYKKLCDYGYKPYIIPSNFEYIIPEWVGLIFFDFREFNISKDEFFRLSYERCIDVNEKEIEKRWELLYNIVNEKNNQRLNIEKLRSILSEFIRRKRYINFEKVESNLVLSTIHRSKGLEFDNVLLIVPNTVKNEKLQAKIVYVGATRASKWLRVKLMDSKLKYNESSKRWIRLKKKRNKWNSISFGNDEDFDNDAIFYGIKDMREFIIRERELIRTDESDRFNIYMSDNGWIIRKIMNKNSKLIICKLSDIFEEDINNLYKTRHLSIPREFSGGRFIMRHTSILGENSPLKELCPSGIFVNIKIGDNKLYGNWS